MLSLDGNKSFNAVLGQENTWLVLWCRGRARAHGSHYVLMLEQGNRDHELLLSQVVG